MLKATNGKHHTLRGRGIVHWISGLLAALVFVSQAVLADAPLKSKLELSTDQAQVVSGIQKLYRAEKRGIRQVLNRESRKLRRAKSENNTAAIVQLTNTVSALEQKMQAAILKEDDEIRSVLNATQSAKFESYIQQRNQMAGSSRDAKVL